MNKIAFITGINGQAGSYLAELLLEKGYEIHGIIRRASVFNTERINHLIDDNSIKLYYGDVADSSNLNRLLRKIQPDEIYNLAAQSHVKVSFEVPEYTADINALGTLRLLDAIRDTGINTKFYQASTSELFGGQKLTPYSESDNFYPRSPYAIAKLYGYWITVNYREAYDLFACNGILFNFESPRRGKRFVTRKITRGIARIKKGLQNKIYLGNLNAKRDWGFCPEFTKGMWMMLQQEEPDDYILATGETHTIREFVTESFKYAGYDINWEGEGLEEKGIDSNSNKCLIEIAERYFRPTEADFLCGNPTKAKEKLGWEPKVKFKELVQIMMEADLNER